MVFDRKAFSNDARIARLRLLKADVPYVKLPKVHVNKDQFLHESGDNV